MKKLLSSLVCYVFLHVQAFALSGGPSGAGGLANVVGSYAGTMTPVLDVFRSPAALLDLDSNALGLFGIKVEEAGLAEGVCAIFNKGEIFTGRMVGVADPKGKLSMVLEARTIRLISGATNTGSGGFFVGSNIVAVGRMDGKIKGGSGGTPARISGTSVVNSFDDTNRDPATGVPILTGFVTFKLDGFKQSDNPTDFDDIDLGVDFDRSGA